MVLMMDKKEEESSSTDYDSDNVRNMVITNTKIMKVYGPSMDFLVTEKRFFIKNDHVESEGDFDSEVESVSSRMSAETVDSQIHLVDQNPISNASDEVDLSGFHDVCRKILAKQIPSGYTSGKWSYLRLAFFYSCIFRYIVQIEIFVGCR